MLPVRLALAVTLASFTGAQNELHLSSAAEAWATYSDPSVGAPIGSGAPSTSGDLFYEVVPGQALLTHDGVIELTGFQEGLYDTDWTTSAPFYDRIVGPACRPAGLGGHEAPDFFCGTSGGTLVPGFVLGLPNPCTLSPPLCGSSLCPPSGYLAGYTLDLQFAPALTIPADGVTSTAVTYFVPGGMTLTTGPPGLCGAGDYVVQDVRSTDEHEDDPLGLGASSTNGFQLAGAGAVPMALGTASLNSPSLGRPVIAPRVAGAGFGPTLDRAGQTVSLASGPLSVGVELHDFYGGPFGGGSGGLGNLVIAGASLAGTFPLPGAPLHGANLLLVPDAVFLSVVGQWTGVVSHGFGASPHVVFAEGVYQSSQVPVPLAPLSIWLQAFTVDTVWWTVRASTTFRMDVNP